MLTLGDLTVDPPVVLAPMAGITNTAFRTLCREQGAALYVSEMISSRALVESGRKTARMLTFGDDEHIRSVQLYGVDPAVVGEAARRLVDAHGIHHLDLNFGCPVAKVTRRGGGAALPIHRALFGAIVAAAVDAAGPVPVTVKMRVGVDDEHHTFLEAGRIARDEGASAVTLHARTAEQLYSGGADWNAIAELKASLAGIPVLGNGDIWHASDALAMVDATGCDGVVVGRGCLGRPWLFRDLVNAFAGRAIDPPPNLGAVTAVMRRHTALLCDLLGERAGVRDFRKHVSWYLTGYPVGAAMRQALPTVSTQDELARLLDELDPAITLPEGCDALPRGRTSGPRPVRLPDGWLATRDDLTPPRDAEMVATGG